MNQHSIDRLSISQGHTAFYISSNPYGLTHFDYFPKGKNEYGPLPDSKGTSGVEGGAAPIRKLSSDWHEFRAKLNRLHPPGGKPTQLSLEFADEKETDNGKGL